MDEPLDLSTYRGSVRIATEAMNDPIVTPASEIPTDTLEQYRNLLNTDVNEAFTVWTRSYNNLSSGGADAFVVLAQVISEAAFNHDIIPREILGTGGASDFCEAVISQRNYWFYDQHPSLIYAILTIIDGIHLAAASIARSTGDRTITRHPELVHLVGVLATSAWAHRGIFVDGGRSDGYCIGWAKALRMRMLSFLPLMYPCIIETSDACMDYSRLVILCWYHSPDSASADINFSNAFRHLPPRSAEEQTTTGPLLDDDDLEPEPVNPNYNSHRVAWLFTQHDIIEVYGLENFLRRVDATIRQPLLRDRFLFLFLQNIEKWFPHPQILPRAAASGILTGLRDAVERQALHGEDGFQWLTTVDFMLIAQFVSALLPAADGAAYVIRDCAIVELLARGTRLAAHLRSTEPDSSAVEQRDAYDSCILSLKRFSTIAQAVNMRAGKNNLRKILRQAMRREWYPTLLHIRDVQTLILSNHRAKYTSLVSAWKTFGEVVGMDEAQAKKDHDHKVKRDARFCSWADCQYHGSPPPNLLACKGCGEVRYCSKSCQRKDWYNGRHKLRCRRLKQT
ncbi:unnamed protein product [Peniophora sp. CBMAI 1063]|nr:unnamed protein product [Peniophora sp. CBMAI 1063]